MLACPVPLGVNNSAHHRFRCESEKKGHESERERERPGRKGRWREAQFGSCSVLPCMCCRQVATAMALDVHRMLLMLLSPPFLS